MWISSFQKVWMILRKHSEISAAGDLKRET